MEIRYPARFEEQPEGGYCVQFIDLPEVITEGDTMDAALFNAAEALTGMLDFYLDKGQAFAHPTQGVQGAHYVAPDARTQAVLATLL